MASGQCTATRHFSSEYTGGDNAGEFASVVSRVCWMRTSDTKHIEHSTLGFEDRTATQGAHFDRRHRDTDLKIASETG